MLYINFYIGKMGLEIELNIEKLFFIMNKKW